MRQYTALCLVLCSFHGTRSALLIFGGFIHLGVRLLESGAFEGYLRYILLWISCFMSSNSESDIGLFVISISGIAGDFP